MRKRQVVMVALLAAVLVVAAPGCVSKKMFRSNVEDTDTRVGSMESAVEANERRISDLKSETDSRIAAVDSKADKAAQVGNAAMSKADQAAMAAEKAANGKLLWTVTLSDERVKFSFGEHSVPDDAATVLDDLAGKVKGYGKALYLEIEGHTDSTGSEEYNSLLAEKRAMAVRDYLNKHGGIPLHAMSTISHGESSPVADNSTPTGRAQNRRVVIRVLE
jgi:outer membrane protein OmpA-like peptidoglycan-associated protein